MLAACAPARLSTLVRAETPSHPYVPVPLKTIAEDEQEGLA